MKILSHETSHKERQAYWDKLSEKYTPVKNALSTRIYGEGEWRLISKYFKNLAGKKLLKLDLWNEANNTDISERAIHADMKVTGIDISKAVTKRAIANFKKKNLKARFVVGDIRKMPFKNKEFDYVYTMGTIEHIPNPEKAIQEIHRVLKPGGIAIIGVPYRYDPFLRAAIAYLADKYGFGPYGEELCFSWGELKKLINTASFDFVAQSGVYFIPWPIRLADLSLYRKPFLRPLTYFLYPLLFICRILGKVNFLLAHNGLIAAVVRKN